jgi:hypothetical protein
MRTSATTIPIAIPPSMATRLTWIVKAIPLNKNGQYCNTCPNDDSAVLPVLRGSRRPPPEPKELPYAAGAMYLGSLYSMIAASRSSCIASTTDCRKAANAGSFLLNPIPIGNGMSA